MLRWGSYARPDGAAYSGRWAGGRRHGDGLEFEGADCWLAFYDRYYITII